MHTRSLFRPLVVGLLVSAPFTTPLRAGDTPDCTATAGTAVAPAERFKSLTVEEVAGKMARKEPLHVIDNNPPDVYAKRHLPGALWLNHRTMKKADLPADKSAALLFYCYSER